MKNNTQTDRATRTSAKARRREGMALWKAVLRSRDGDFAQWLIEYRNNYNVTQKEIARLLEVSPPRISEWERKIRTPKPLTQLGIKNRLKRK